LARNIPNENTAQANDMMDHESLSPDKIYNASTYLNLCRDITEVDISNKKIISIAITTYGIDRSKLFNMLKAKDTFSFETTKRIKLYEELRVPLRSTVGVRWSKV
jgi:hypothetical protein